ncbi:hypothetical protein Scep_005786 [Stephania cephalantha]|uniref:Methyltransferase FkbM domain-containing protein n=1 Tax=Stephania cephalantha TaxID=152367 RepID=A0AAP0KWQ2_9MAGN
MESKPNSVKNLLVRVFLFSVLVLVVRFAYVVTIRGGSCDSGDFCFFSSPENVNLAGIQLSSSSSAAVSAGDGASSLWTSKEWRKSVDFYSSVFQDLLSHGFLFPKSKVLCVDSVLGQEVFALKEIGVKNAIGIAKKASPPLVRYGQGFKQPFGDNSFDFIFSGGGGIDRTARVSDFAAEIGRTLKPEGFLVVHTASTKDVYSFNSFLRLFNCCGLVTSRHVDGFDSSMPPMRELVLKKSFHTEILYPGEKSLGGKCSVPGYKQELVRKAEPIIAKEPLKPWISLKRNIQNVKYLPSMADINFKQRYIYIDVGARSYGSSIGSWFKKQYPKQNKTFEVYAIEADKTFHEQYSTKKAVTLLPYAAWVRNETLLFEINKDPGKEVVDIGRGMGRIRPVQAEGSSGGNVDKIQGFDFANWLKNTVSENDFVVMKMDVEGTEFDLIPRLFETGAICLVDEIFLECHYNRWQKCCPGERSSKYEKTYDQCLELFHSLRESGVLVHQWW